MASCRKCSDPSDPSCSNYNPCYNQQATTAMFTMVEYTNTIYLDSLLKPYWKQYDSDSALDKVTFTAALDSAVYEWHIGAGVYTTQSFTLDFTAAPRPSIIPITLIVHKQPNQKCFPGGKSIDTLTRNLNIIYDPDSIYFTGTYQGAFADAPSTQITYSIITKILSYYPYKYYYITNFFASGDTTQIGLGGNGNDLITIWQRYFSAGNANANLNIEVISNLSPNGQVTVTFLDQNQATAVKSLRFFKGQKMQ
jgi:hypothetical protein